MTTPLQVCQREEKAQVSAEVERVLEDLWRRGQTALSRKVENDLFYAVMESRHLHDREQPIPRVGRGSPDTGQRPDAHTLIFPSASADGALRWRKRKVCPLPLDMALGRGG